MYNDNNDDDDDNDDDGDHGVKNILIWWWSVRLWTKLWCWCSEDGAKLNKYINKQKFINISKNENYF